MCDEPAAPAAIAELQDWFGSALHRPIDIDNNVSEIGPRGGSINEEAAQSISSSSTLAPHERIAIYNRQYWWRLLTCLQEDYPLTLRLFGNHEFNRVLAIPYLTAHPPEDWKLHAIGDMLPTWAYQHYHAADRVLVGECLDFDLACHQSFIASRQKPLSVEELNENISLTLQPYLRLLSFSADIPTFRQTFVTGDGDHWLDKPWPPLNSAEAPYHYIIWRTADDHLLWRRISLPELQLLDAFTDGATVEEACEALDEQSSALAETSIHFWFHEWTTRGWLCILDSYANLSKS